MNEQNLTPTPTPFLSAHYRKDLTLTNLNEIIITATPQNFSTLFETIQSRLTPEIDIVIDITALNVIDTIPLFKLLLHEWGNVIARIDFLKQSLDSFLLVSENIPFFFKQQVTNKQALYAEASYQPYSIYVTSELAFEMADLTNYRLRLVPNAATTNPHFDDYIPNICKFFIRPEDIDYYTAINPNITFEIADFGDRTNLIINIYRQKQFLGGLSQIIQNYYDDIDNKTIFPSFGKTRVNCKQKCLLGKCKFCLRIEEMAEAMEENNVTVITKRSVINPLSKETAFPADPIPSSLGSDEVSIKNS